MNASIESQTNPLSFKPVPAGKDKFGEFRGLGISSIAFKLTPRQIPHVWAYAGGAQGRMLIAFSPAGKMESFFREVTKDNAMPAQDPDLWRLYGMELLGPPLEVE